MKLRQWILFSMTWTLELKSSSINLKQNLNGVTFDRFWIACLVLLFIFLNSYLMSKPISFNVKLPHFTARKSWPHFMFANTKMTLMEETTTWQTCLNIIKFQVFLHKIEWSIDLFKNTDNTVLYTYMYSVKWCNKQDILLSFPDIRKLTTIFML